MRRVSSESFPAARDKAGMTKPAQVAAVPAASLKKQRRERDNVSLWVSFMVGPPPVCMTVCILNGKYDGTV